MPIITLRKLPVATVEEIGADRAARLRAARPGLSRRVPARPSAQPSPESFARALREGKATYIAEACWHCHSQFVRPVSNEDLRFGPVSTPAEYQNMMNLPHLFGTRRVGPDLIREAGKHSNDWQMAHLYDPRSVAPYSVMPSYPWFFDASGGRRSAALALVSYLQWLGSWIPEDQRPGGR